MEFDGRMARLTADFRIGALRRHVEGQGGFATVLHRGDSTSGDILLVLPGRDEPAHILGRRMTGGGEYTWSRVGQDADSDQAVTDYLARARRRDPDLWVLEVDVSDRARFVEWLPTIN